YHTPPPNYFALYSDFNQSGMQWVFKDTEGLTRLDDPVTNAAGAISSASNQTQYTIELFQNNNGTGASQLVYPTITTDITTTGLEDHITSVNLYHGPPANYFCLYQGSWSGTQWVFKDTAGLTNLTDLQYGGASSAITFNNRTQYTLELFQNTDGTGTSQLAYPIAKNLMATPGLQGNLKSVNVYHGPPNNYFALYENQFNTGRQWVLKDTAGLINLAGSQYGDASSVISSASNQTIYTLELFQNTDGTGTSQLVYPNTTVNTDAIADRITSVNVYHGPPTNYFCLYQEWYEYGRQWVFKDTAGLTNFTNTAVFGDLSHVISCVKNQTQYTLEIFRNSNGTGTSQLIYPTTTINVASALNEVVTSVNVYHGPPNNYFCLYEANAQGMRQWAFKDTAGLTDLTNTGIFNNASSVISSVNNLTLYTLELFQNANGSGTSQLVYPNTTPNVTTSGLNDTVKSVNLYHGPPNNYFCLYQDNVSDSSRQWVFRSNPGHIDLTNTAVYGTAASVLSAALNKSPNPIELFDQASQNGNIQLVPPSSQVDGFINNLNDKIKSFTVYQPSGFPTPCMLVAKHSGKCIDVQQFSTTPNTTVWQYQVNNTANQQWIIVNSGGGVYRIYSVNSLLCLGPQNGAGGSSVPIAQLTPTTAGYLYWHVVDQGGGYYRLWNYDNGYSIDVSGSSTANQAAIIQYGNTGGDNQRFSMRATTAAAKNTGAAQNGTDPNSDREDNSKENTELGGSLPRGYRAES
ncbi:RICIN domain-containing protein, partial [Kitasatospora sp. NPDC091257]